MKRVVTTMGGASAANGLLTAEALPDEGYFRIDPLLSVAGDKGGRPWVGQRRVAGAIIWHRTD